MNAIRMATQAHRDDRAVVDGLIADLATLRAQRDELLAALRDLVGLSSHLKFTGPEDSPRLYCSAAARARAAIARAEGGAK